jgi:phenylpropionate dioxygenase-like ring-hydroxylating dioxygenase large terminal subunit
LRTSDEFNLQTQPRETHRIFNRWDLIPDGWYIALESSRLKKEQVRSVQIAGQHLVVFRGKSGLVSALDGFCPHMGVDLGIGKVEGEQLRCFFHHWKFDRNGDCTAIPCQEKIPSRAKLKHYRVREAYGFIWVHPNEKAIDGVLEVPELVGEKSSWLHGKSYHRSCHHHITMINGIDPQHLSTVHGIHMDMDLEIKEPSSNLFQVTLRGKIPSKRLIEKLTKFFVGDNYCYSMTYADGCVASLSVLKEVALFGKFKILPELHMIFGYQTVSPGKTLVQPIYLTRKRKGFWGKLYGRFLLTFTKMAFSVLQGEDGEVYENIRFQTNNLLKMDRPISRYINYINQLRPSAWSQPAEVMKKGPAVSEITSEQKL